MPTKEQNKQRRRTKREERKAIKLYSTVAVGHSVPVPDPPDFGAPRWTDAEQAANPTKPMTRLIKDVLRIGRWKEGFDELNRPVFGDYTPEELQNIFNNARAMMAAGHAINFGKSHGDDQLIIPTDELISPADDIRLDNGILWVSTYVTPEQADYLDNPARKVSAGLHRDYLAGNGTTYAGRTMLHVAVTDRPTVDCQGPFIRLSNYIALGTWSESKHPRKGGKFASTGGGTSKVEQKTSSAKKTGAAAGAALIIGGKHGKAEKAVGKVGKGVLRRVGRVAGRAARSIGQRAGNAAKTTAVKVGKAAAKTGLKVGKAAAKSAGKAATGVAKAAGAHAKQLGQRVAKSGAKAIRSGARAGLKIARSKGVRAGVRAGAGRAIRVCGRILRTVAKSPLRKAVLRFNNGLMRSAIALANTLEGGSSMDPTVLAAINALLQKLGVDPIPEGTPPEQIGPMLMGIAMGLGVQNEEEDAAEDAADAGGTGGAITDAQLAAAGSGAGPIPTAAMSNLLTQVDQRIAAANKPLLDGIASLTAALTAKNAGEVVDKKGKYMTFRNALGKGDAAGLAVSEAVLAAKDKIAEKCDWDLAVLEGLHPNIKLANYVSAAGATETKPEDKPANGMLTDEQIAERIKAKGGDPSNMPKAGV